jgi:hypothetical protein
LKLKDVEGKDEYRVDVSNKFAALENLNAEMNIKSACKTIRENSKFQPK